jgi:maltose/moltooligosaccharide transporter
MYSLVCFAFSFALPAVAQRFGRKTTHSACLVLGGLGLLSVAVIQTQYLLLLSMTGVGIAWASILSMPYAMLAGSLPAERTGTHMGIFNFFIVIPEILAALCFGWIMRNLLANNRLSAVVAGGFFLLLAALLTQRVRDGEA